MKVLSGVAAVAALALSSATNPIGAQQPPVFSARSELVVLHVSVTGRGGAHVSGLPASAFRVFEDGRPQTIQFFAAEDAPATIGLLIDSSGSMAPVRDRVIAASAAFAASSNRRDEFFSLVFNDDVQSVLPAATPFTSDAAVLQRTLAGAFVPAGRTALFDAIDAGLRYVARGSLDRRALLILSDGGDNASHGGAAGALEAAEASNTVIYGIALFDELDRDADPKRLARLADATGGLSFEPRGVTDIDRAFQQIASDIRQAYTLGYVPDGGRPAGFRRIRVDVNSPDGRKVIARTRRGYHAR